MSRRNLLLAIMVFSNFAACQTKNPRNEKEAILLVRKELGESVANLVAEPDKTFSHDWPEKDKFEILDNCHVGVLEENAVISFQGYDFQTTTYDVCQCTAEVIKVKKSSVTDVLHPQPLIQETEFNSQQLAGFYKADSLVRLKYGQ